VRETDGGFTCTCPWYADKVGEAGPCKHILAVQIALDEPEDE
jgi:predicted nucleic acid-binding Zn finger protein